MLFVATPDGRELDDDLQHRLRSAFAPRCRPNTCRTKSSLESIPMTLSGKKTELPVKKILLGSSARDVASPDSLRNPRSLDEVIAVARGRQVELPK